MTFEETLTIPTDHPALAGHFPDNPVVPGVVLLDKAVAIVRRHAGRQVRGISRAKFHTPLRADTPMLMRLVSEKNKTMRLTCTVGSVRIMTAILECDESTPVR